MEGENIYQSLSIHSSLHTHWSIIHLNTLLINYPFISYYYILIRCRHSFTPLLTQTQEMESRKYKNIAMPLHHVDHAGAIENAYTKIKDACVEIKDACAGNTCIGACARRYTCIACTHIPDLCAST